MGGVSRLFFTDSVSSEESRNRFSVQTCGFSRFVPPQQVNPSDSSII